MWLHNTPFILCPSHAMHHSDLSNNVICEDGAEALARALVPITSAGEVDAQRGAHSAGELQSNPNSNCNSDYNSYSSQDHPERLPTSPTPPGTSPPPPLPSPPPLLSPLASPSHTSPPVLPRHPRSFSRATSRHFGNHSTLTSLDLGENFIATEGAFAIARMLSGVEMGVYNHTLTSLDLQENGICYEGASVIARALTSRGCQQGTTVRCRECASETNSRDGRVQSAWVACTEHVRVVMSGNHIGQNGETELAEVQRKSQRGEV